MIVPGLNIHHQDSDVRLWKWQARWCNTKLRHHSLSCRAPVHCSKNGLCCALSQSSLQWPESRGQNKRWHETKVVVLLSSCSALQIWPLSLLAAEIELTMEVNIPDNISPSEQPLLTFFIVKIKENVFINSAEQSQEYKNPFGIMLH